MRVWAALLAGMLALATPAQASDFPQIDRARALLGDAEVALRRAGGKQDQLAALGQAVHAHETALSVLRNGLRAMVQEDQALTIGLEQDRAQLSEVLGALQSISQAPQSALLVFPGGPADAARAAILMAEIAPQLEVKVAAIETRLDEIRQLRTQQEIARVEARGALATLQDLRARTAQVMRSRTKRIARKELTDQAKAAAAQAASLADLAAVLRAALQPNAPSAAFETLRGALPLPVAGRQTGSFGQASSGEQSFGITLTAPAFAQVSAPMDATVRYAGPLIGYAEVVVLEPEDGWLLVIAGLDRVDRAIGEAVLAGEKLGDLGGPLPTSEEFLLEAGYEAGQIGEETLYIELRRGDQPIDPAPWFARNG